MGVQRGGVYNPYKNGVMMPKKNGRKYMGVCLVFFCSHPFNPSYFTLLK